MNALYHIFLVLGLSSAQSPETAGNVFPVQFRSNGASDIKGTETPDCVNGPAGCNIVQDGKPGSRFCCVCVGSNPIGCSNSACNSGPFVRIRVRNVQRLHPSRRQFSKPVASPVCLASGNTLPFEFKVPRRPSAFAGVRVHASSSLACPSLTRYHAKIRA